MGKRSARGDFERRFTMMEWKCPRCGEICTDFKISVVDDFTPEIEVTCMKCALRWYPENIPKNYVPDDTIDVSRKRLACPNCKEKHIRNTSKKENGITVSERLCLICGFRWNPEEFVDDTSDFQDGMTGEDYERLVKDRLERMGYTQVRITKRSNDYGADIEAFNPWGKCVGIQCKHYKGSVSVHAVQEIIGSKPIYGFDELELITNSHLTENAKTLAHANGIKIRENFK